MDMPTKRILFLHPSSDLYGADRTLLDLVSSLPGQGFEVCVALPCEGPLSEALRQLSIQVRVGPLGVVAMGDLSPLGLVRLAFAIPAGAMFVRKLARTFRPDIIHTNTMIVLGGALGARLARAKHLWHIHEIPTSPSWLAGFGARLFHFLADQVVWNSEATGHAFLRHHHGLIRKATVIHNGIDANRLQPMPSRTTARELLGWPANAPIALVIGRINSWKGQSLAVDSLALLSESHPNLHLAFVGSHPEGQERYEKELRAHAVRSGVEDRILWHKFSPQVAQFYAAADFLVLPSTRPEPFGLVVLEAFAAGLPVIASAHGGPMEIVRPGKDGLLFEPGSAQALAASMAELLECAEVRKVMGQQARDRQRTHFSLRAYQERFKQLYRQSKNTPQALTDAESNAPWPDVIHVVLGKANPARMNGVNRVVHGLASHQRSGVDSYAEVWGLCSDPDAPTPLRPYRLRTFPRYKWRHRIAPGLAARILRIAECPERGAPVFHLHGAFLPEMAHIAKELRRLGLAYVFTSHGAYVDRAMGKRRLLKELYARAVESKLVRGARALQALSAEEVDALKERFPRAEVTCIAPGQDLETGAKPSVRCAGQPLRIGSMGRIDTYTKGLDSLLDGLALFLRQGGHAHLDLAGDGQDLCALKQRAIRLGLEDHITWCGEIHGQEKHRFLQGLDVYVQLSRHEGLPGAPLEAAAHGCPLIVTEATHLGSLIEKHGAGWVVLDGNRDTVAGALKSAAAQSDEQWMHCGQGALRMVDQEFSWSQIALAMHQDLYRLPTRSPEPQSAV
ncbi:MAG: glycosyltransferase [Planctomycetes bacterium]|nr:glycosyltransferase [Planctomycetota bacterium]